MYFDDFNCHETLSHSSPGMSPTALRWSVLLRMDEDVRLTKTRPARRWKPNQPRIDSLYGYPRTKHEKLSFLDQFWKLESSLLSKNERVYETFEDIRKYGHYLSQLTHKLFVKLSLHFPTNLKSSLLAQFRKLALFKLSQNRRIVFGLKIWRLIFGSFYCPLTKTNGSFYWYER